MRTATELRGELERARQALTAATPSFDGDPATARLGPVALRQHQKRTDTELQRYSDAFARVQRLKYALIAAEGREAEATRVPLSAAEVIGAVAVRDRHGWHRVVRVNGLSVTVETGYSWTDRIPFGKVLEVRR